MSNDVAKTILTARPPFRFVSPLVAKIVLVFGIGNILLGIALFTYKAQLMNFQAINHVTTYQVWGVLFTLLGAAMLYSYFKNLWVWMRKALFVGILIKTYWMVALLSRYFTGEPPNLIVLIIWGIITTLQIVTYIDFIPVPREGARDERIT